MNEIVKLLCSLSISSAILIVIVSFILKFLENKLSKRWQYYIWIIVAIRLVIPFGFAYNFASSIPTTFSTSNIIMEDESIENNINQTLMNTEGNYQIRNIEKIFDTIPIGSIVVVIWLLGTTILLVRKITSYQSFLKYIKVGRTSSVDIEELEILSELCDNMGINKVVDVGINDLIGTPLLIGIHNPKILLPSNEFSREEKNYIYIHELTHLQRKDIVYKWFLQFVLCIHWFNPFVHYMVKKANQLCELSCDEKIISSLSLQEKKNYGNTLLSSLKSNKTYNEPIATLALSENASLLLQRLSNIKTYQKINSSASVLSFVLAVCITVVALFSGGTFYRPETNKLLLSTIPNPNQYESFVVDETVMMLIETDDANDRIWYIVEYLIPYMTHDGIDNAVNFFNTKYSGEPKIAQDYYNYPIPSQEETLYRATEIINRTNNWTLVEPLLPYLSRDGLYRMVELYNSKNGHKLNPEDYTNSLFMKD